MGPVPGWRLTADEDRRVDDVVRAATSARSVRELLATTLAAIDEHLGPSDTAFMLAVRDATNPYTGVKHGTADYVLEEYFERWVRYDALASPAAMASYQHHRWASIDELYNSLDGARRRYVDDFLRRNHQQHQFSVQLTSAHSDAYLTIASPEQPDQNVRRMITALAPRISALLHERMPHGLPDPQSLRAQQVCELVALGFSNRQIGVALGIEERTVEKHLERIYASLHLPGRVELAAAWATGRRTDLTPGALHWPTDTAR